MEQTQQKEVATRDILIQDREIDKLLRKRSDYAGDQLKAVKQIKKYQTEYEYLQKEIADYNKDIIYNVYKKYISHFGEYEDIYEVKIQGGKILLRLKDALEEIKAVAKDKFLTNKLNFLKTQEINDDKIGNDTTSN